IDLKGGAESAWNLVTAANQFIVQTAPWSLARQGNDAELDRTLAALSRALVRLAILAFPFLPSKAAALWESLRQDAELARAWAIAENPPVSGRKVRKPDNLFPKPPPPNP